MYHTLNAQPLQQQEQEGLPIPKPPPLDEEEKHSSLLNAMKNNLEFISANSDKFKACIELMPNILLQAEKYRIEAHHTDIEQTDMHLACLHEMKGYLMEKN